MKQYLKFRSADSQSGAIAIYLTSILALLLLASTTLAARQQVSELNQSSHVDRSEEAYYAAEAGVEEASRRIDEALLANSHAALCDPYPMFAQQYDPASCSSTNQPGDAVSLTDVSGNWITNLSSAIFTDSAANSSLTNGQLMWRSRKVTLQPAYYSGTQVKDETVQINATTLCRITPTGTYGDNTSCLNPPATTLAAAAGTDEGGDLLHNNFTGVDYFWSNDNSAASAQIELTIVSYPAANVGAINTQKLLFNSGTSGGCTLPSSTSFTNCFRYPGNGITLNPNLRYIFRIKPIFGTVGNATTPAGDQSNYSVHYQATLIDQLADKDHPITTADKAYVIDVVGQAGDTRRRIVAQKLGSHLIGIFDYVIYSGDRTQALCKVGVQQTSGGYNANCTANPASN